MWKLGRCLEDLIKDNILDQVLEGDCGIFVSGTLKRDQLNHHVC